jgi:Polyketide cyclase / dehydrase and lipid transport
MTEAAIEVVREVELARPAAEVWALIGPFGALADWLPVLESCEIAQVQGRLHRHLRTIDGEALLEELVAHDDAGMTYTYDLLDGPLPVDNYRSTLRVVPAGHRCRVVWTSRFDPAADVGEHDAARIIEGIYEAGLGALVDRFRG